MSVCEEREVKSEKEGSSETIIAILYPVLQLVFLKLFGQASSLQNFFIQRQS